MKRSMKKRRIGNRKHLEGKSDSQTELEKIAKIEDIVCSRVTIFISRIRKTLRGFSQILIGLHDFYYIPGKYTAFLKVLAKNQEIIPKKTVFYVYIFKLGQI